MYFYLFIKLFVREQVLCVHSTTSPRQITFK